MKMLEISDGIKSSRKFPVFVTGILTLIAFVLLLSVKLTTATTSLPEQEKQVRDFIAAFNERNLDGMLEATDEGIQWLSVDGAKIAVETEGKKALRESMEKYFRSCPSCQSSLVWVQSAGGRVTALERASWRAKSGARAQSSLSVYEFRNGKILRVYYFPVEAETKAPAKGCLTQVQPDRSHFPIDGGSNFASASVR